MTSVLFEPIRNAYVVLYAEIDREPWRGEEICAPMPDGVFEDEEMARGRLVELVDRWLIRMWRVGACQRERVWSGRTKWHPPVFAQGGADIRSTRDTQQVAKEPGHWVFFAFAGDGRGVASPHRPQAVCYITPSERMRLKRPDIATMVRD